MKRKFEKFKIIRSCDDESKYIDSLPEYIYILGHHLEDGLTKESLNNYLGIELKEQFKFCYIGKVKSTQINSSINLLIKNFISGYIVWFDDSIDITPSEFGDFFIGERKKGLLTYLYSSRIKKDFTRDISVDIDYIGKINGIIFTESDEPHLMLVRKNN